MELASAKEHRAVVTKSYYEKLGGFSYLLSELRKRIGREQTDALVNDAVSLCNELCDKYKGLSKKEIFSHPFTAPIIMPLTKYFCRKG